MADRQMIENFIPSIRSTVTFIGTAVNGPVNVPICPKNYNHALAVFGDKGSLMDAYRICLENGNFDNIILIKTSGSYAEGYLNINDNSKIIRNGLHIRSKHANEDYNNAKIILDDDALYIYQENNKDGRVLSEYSYYKTDDLGDFIYNESGRKVPKTLNELCFEINQDTRNLKGDFFFYSNADNTVLAKSGLIPVNQREIVLYGGNSGLYYNKNMMYMCLSDTYACLEGIQTDYVIPLNCYYDDTFSDNEEDLIYYNLDREYLTLKKGDRFLSFYEQALRFAVHQMNFGYLTIIIMGCHPTENPFINQEYYLNYLEHFNKINKTDISLKKYRQLVSVCALDVYSAHGTRIHNFYILYALMCCFSDFRKSTTNMRFPESFSCYNNFTTRNLKALAELGFTAPRNSVYKGTAVINAGVTTGEGDFKYLTNIKMCHIVMKYVNKNLENLIGEQTDKILKRGLIERNITYSLNKMISLDIIKKYKIEKITKLSDSKIKAELTFTAKYMAEAVTAYTGIDLESGSFE